jgi:hypothetical protein
MPHEVHASIVVTLPDGPEDMVAALATVATNWANMLHSFAGEDVVNALPVAQTFTVNETRTKAARSAIVTARAPRRRSTTEAATAAIHYAAEQLALPPSMSWSAAVANTATALNLSPACSATRPLRWSWRQLD